MRTFGDMRAGPACLPALLLAASCAHKAGVGLPPEQTGPVIEALKVEGNHALKSGKIRSGLATKAPGWWPWSAEHRLDAVALATDLERVRTLYALHGYYDARVTEETVSVRGGGVRVVLRIDEGEPTSLRELSLLGLEHLDRPVRERVMRRLPLVTGQVLKEQAYEDTLRFLKMRLLREGYAAAAVQGRVDVYPDEHEAVADIEVQTGPVFRYGQVQVSGLRTLPAGPVEAMVRRAAPAGDRYNPKALDDAQARVFGLGAFAAVRVVVDPDDPTPSRATVRVVVEEAATHTLVLGGGVGVETNLWQLLASAEYRNTNLLGGARRLVFHNELALRFLPSSASPTTVQRGLAADSFLELVEPEVFSRTDAALRVGLERAFTPAYDARRLYLRLGFPYHLARLTEVSPFVEYSRYPVFTGPVPVGARPLPLPSTCAAPCQLFSAGVAVSVDRRNDPVYTRSGTLWLAEVRYGVPGEFHYLRVVPEARLYVPAMSRLVLAGRLRVGALFTFGGTPSPMPQRFFGGGESDHRGFGADLLAPSVQDGTNAFAPIGGDGMYLASIEVRLRLNRTWETVVFADYGNVTVEPLFFRPAQAHLALGLGARLFTLVGPVRVDLGYRVDRRELVALDTGAHVPAGRLGFFTLFVGLGEAF